jgi:hypothetical protein
MRCTNFSFIFGIELYMFRTGFLSIIRSLVLYTQQEVLCLTGFLFANGIRMDDSASKHNLYDITLLLCTQYETPNDGQKICSKQVEFYSKNKFEKLVHIVGFIIRMGHSDLCVLTGTCKHDL